MNKKEAANCDCWDVSRFSVFQLAAKETRAWDDSGQIPSAGRFHGIRRLLL